MKKVSELHFSLSIQLELPGKKPNVTEPVVEIFLT